jgi:hypothetical protein
MTFSHPPSHPKTHPQPLAFRLWRYQAERAPIIAIILMAALTVGVIAHYAAPSLSRYLVAVMIVVLYLVQIRASDEKKDFDHDNKFYPHRPVQRGLISLAELGAITKIVIIAQLVLYASFLSWHIFLLGLASQAYAFLTRKEFFARAWIRQKFLIYNFTHYLQLILLFVAVINIIQPTPSSFGALLLFVVLNIAVVELGRKTRPAADDVAQDTYSWRLGYRPVAVALAITATLTTACTLRLMAQGSQTSALMILPLAALAAVITLGVRYGRHPSAPRQKAMENGVLLMFLVGMASVILGG